MLYTRSQIMYPHSSLNGRRLFTVTVFILVLGCGCGSRGEGQADRMNASHNLVVVEARPDRGFRYPYVLRIPRDHRAGERSFLLVEPNNTGTVSDDFNMHLEAAKETSSKAIGAFIACTENLPLLVPVFPRPETQWQIYTHLLDRDAMLLTEGPMQRLDLQLIAMVEDAKEKLADAGLMVDQRILLTGFSASGTFVNRFTALHPGLVQAAASGGVNGMLMLPVGTLADSLMPYPLGVADFETITGQPFDLASWRKVPQFIYMGSNDENDAVCFDDGYSERERKLIFTLLGERMQPDRWEKCQAMYLAAGAAVTFRTYEGIGHRTNSSINAEIAAFFRASMEKSASRYSH